MTAMPNRAATPLRLGILVSGRGSNLQSILDEIAADNLAAQATLVLSDTEGALALERARRAGVSARSVIRSGGESTEAFESRLAAELKAHNADLIVLAGFMRVLSPFFIESFRGRIINIHPSLLPSFPGLHAQRQALEWGVKITGCTVHFVDESLDGGPIIAQEAVEVLPGDTEETLSARILEQEHRLLPQVIGQIAAGQISYCEETSGP